MCQRSIRICGSREGFPEKVTLMIEEKRQVRGEEMMCLPSRGKHRYGGVEQDSLVSPGAKSHLIMAGMF